MTEFPSCLHIDEYIDEDAMFEDEDGWHISPRKCYMPIVELGDYLWCGEPYFSYTDAYEEGIAKYHEILEKGTGICLGQKIAESILIRNMKNTMMKQTFQE